MGEDFLAAVIEELTKNRRLAERAMEQLQDEELFRRGDPDGNSVAVIVKHMAGNMRSRWTDVFTSDGEKPDRDRDREFVEATVSRDEVLATWRRGWDQVFSFLESIGSDDLARVIQIRGEPHTLLRGIVRQTGHYAYHVGQIVSAARAFRGDQWQSLSIPRGRSAEYLR